MQSSVDWHLIKQEYEAGASKQALSIKYGITRQAIIKRARKESWITHLVTSPQDIVTSPVTDEIEDNSDRNTLAYARRLIAQRIREDPENKDIKMLMDSFSQVKKIEMMLPAEQFAYDMRDFLRKCTPEELAIIQPIVEAVNQREAEKEMKPLRKTG